MTKTDFFKDKVILITGGTGTLGTRITKRLLKNHSPKKVIIFSRDEFKQYTMKSKIDPLDKNNAMRYFIGDVRDKERLHMALFSNQVNFVIHAAALKHVPIAEYNPFEFINTNINGGQNIIQASFGVDSIEGIVALSTDKACSPTNLYGATKLCSDKIFSSAANVIPRDKCSVSVVRYGNVVGSRGSVIPFFKKLLQDKSVKELPITSYDMTRFLITIDQGVDMVLYALQHAKGGEIFVPKIPSIKITQIAEVLAPDIPTTEIGIRPGEKLHEMMINEDDARDTFNIDNYYVITPSGDKQLTDYYNSIGGKQITDKFSYSSDNNEWWLDNDELAELIKSQEDYMNEAS